VDKPLVPLNSIHGIPDEDTFRRIFERVNPAELMKCLQNWLGGMSEAGWRQVAIDGKTAGRKGAMGRYIWSAYG
jgi:hypothetical protein